MQPTADFSGIFLCRRWCTTSNTWNWRLDIWSLFGWTRFLGSLVKGSWREWYTTFLDNLEFTWCISMCISVSALQLYYTCMKSQISRDIEYHVPFFSSLNITVGHRWFRTKRKVCSCLWRLRAGLCPVKGNNSKGSQWSIHWNPMTLPPKLCHGKPGGTIRVMQCLPFIFLQEGWLWSHYFWWRVEPISLNRHEFVSSLCIHVYPGSFFFRMYCFGYLCVVCWYLCWASCMVCLYLCWTYCLSSPAWDFEFPQQLRPQIPEPKPVGRVVLCIHHHTQCYVHQSLTSISLYVCNSNTWWWTP